MPEWHTIAPPPQTSCPVCGSVTATQLQHRPRSSRRAAKAANAVTDGCCRLRVERWKQSAGWKAVKWQGTRARRSTEQTRTQGTHNLTDAAKTHKGKLRSGRCGRRRSDDSGPAGEGFGHPRQGQASSQALPCHSSTPAQPHSAAANTRRLWSAAPTSSARASAPQASACATAVGTGQGRSIG